MRASGVVVISVAVLSAFTVTGCREGAPAAADPPPSRVATSAPVGPAAPSAPASSPGVARSAAIDTAIGSRMAAARAFIAGRPGTIGLVVRDRVTGAVWRAGNTTQLNWTASTIKLAISAAILDRQRAGQLRLTAGDRANMHLSLVNSDNDATTALWTKFDGAGMLTRFRTAYGMATLGLIPGQPVSWRSLHCSAQDLANLMSYVLDRMPAPDRDYLVSALRGVASLQHWGVWAAGPSMHPGNKDGWAQKPDNGVTHWVTHSVGFAGDDERYVVAVMYRLTATGTLAQGAHTTSDLIATVFGAKTPAPISIPR